MHKHALELARDTYGNYVIQHSLQHGDDAQRCVARTAAPMPARGRPASYSRPAFLAGVAHQGSTNSLLLYVCCQAAWGVLLRGYLWAGTLLSVWLGSHAAYYCVPAGMMPSSSCGGTSWA